MSERIRGSYNDALYKSTYTLLYFTLTSSKCMVPWAHPNQPPKGIWICSAVFCKACERDHATLSVAIGRILCTECRRCSIKR